MLREGQLGQNVMVYLTLTYYYGELIPLWEQLDVGGDEGRVVWLSGRDDGPYGKVANCNGWLRRVKDDELR
jgi:hypothetical protein